MGGIIRFVKGIIRFVKKEQKERHNLATKTRKQELV